MMRYKIEMCMDRELCLAILSVVGTLLGTVLGWLLNSLSQKGKLHFFVMKWEESFQKLDYGVLINCKFEEATHYYYKLSFDIYNRSREIRILRDIKILFLKKKQVFWLSIPKDDSTKRGDIVTRYSDVSVINVTGRSAINIKLHDGTEYTPEAWHALSNADRIVLEYVNENGKKKRFVIQKKQINTK